MIEDISTRLVPGWFGKIPALGDFASRRLPAELIDAWDAWLQRSLMTSQLSLGDAWTQIYLRSPIWRFALMPGICGPRGWAGILMPSVDKIGRYFPLTIGAPVDAESEMPGASPAAQMWYAGLEHVALLALDVTFGVDDLERALTEHPYPYIDEAPARVTPDIEPLARWWLDANAAKDTPRSFAYPELAAVGEALRGSLASAIRLSTSGKSLWWSAPPIGEAVALHCCVGLPPDDHFALLLQGGHSVAAPLPDPVPPAT